MMDTLSKLRTNSELAAFRVWLIGSRLEPGNVSSDIDLVLAPRIGSLPDESIDRALWFCRHYGLFKADPPCPIDPTFRAYGPAVDLAPLPASVILKSIKLLSPLFVNYILSDKIFGCRPVGTFCLEYLRSAGECSFYHKLPRQNIDGQLLPYLRPALEIC